ncbi:MAG TPA: extracellular solute-binding protein [Promineifilum sp.]|nr:extracellular solute-binding protein [Promineifilum sp.]
MKSSKWYMLVIVLLLGAFVLAACGGKPATPPAQPPAATEAPAVAEPTEAPAAQPTEAPAVEPTEAPAVEEPAGLASDPSKTMGELLAANPNFSTLSDLLKTAGIEEPATDSPGTLFAPDNAAFEAMDQDVLARIKADPGSLTRFLQYQMLGGAVSSDDIAAAEGGRLDTAAGEPVSTADLKITTADVEASNGTIQVVSSVLVPPTITNAILAEQLAAEGKPVIRIWADNTRKPALDLVEKSFEEEYGVELLIEEVGFGNIRSNFIIAGPAGEGPDIIVGAHDWLGELVASGLLSPIDLGDKVADFTPASIDAFSYDGELYGLPNATENVAFFINTDLVPECPATWTEVYQISADLHKADPSKYGFVRMEGDPYHFYPIQTAFGGYVFGRDAAGAYDPTNVGIGDPGSIAAAKWWERMVTEGLQPPAVTWDIQHEMFEAGTSAMQITGPWSTSRTVDSGIPFQICNLPSETAEGKPFLGAQGFMVSAFSRDPLMAQIFLTEFVATPEVMQAFYDADPRPPAYLPVLDKVDDEYIKAFGQAGVNADPMPAIPEMSAVWEAWGNAIVLVAQGSDTAENAFTTAQQQIINALAP